MSKKKTEKQEEPEIKEVKEPEVKEEPKDRIERAEEAAKTLDTLNEEIKATLERLENLKEQEILSGKAEAGQPAPEVKEETPKEYKDRIMAGDTIGEANDK